MRRLVALLALSGVALSGLLLASCGGDPAEPAGATAPVGAGLRRVTPTDAAAIATDPPDDLVVLDVRTEEEFAVGHLDDAVMLDFYRTDFTDRLAELDPDVPYLLYCRSGNRSGQTLAIMEELGFRDVADLDGGIVAWQAAGLPVTSG